MGSECVLEEALDAQRLLQVATKQTNGSYKRDVETHAAHLATANFVERSGRQPNKPNIVT